jgi:hypothetical protein
MKKTFVILFMLFITAIGYAQNGMLIDEGSCYRFKWVSPVTDSAGTFTSPAIRSTDIIALYRNAVVDTGEVDSDSKIVEYFEKYATVNVQVKGAGTVDSLSSLIIQGRTPSDGWITVQTLNTAKEVTCMTTVTFGTVVRTPEIRFYGTVADLTVSAYTVYTYIELVIPKLFKY